MKNNKKDTVFFIAKWYPNRFDDMLGLFVQRHAKAVSLYKSVVVLFAFSSDSATRIILSRQKSHQVSEYVAEYPSRITGLRFLDKGLKFVFYYRALWKCYRLAEKENGRPKVIHVHVLFRTAFFAYCIKRLYKIPYLITEHWSGFLPQNLISLSSFRKRMLLFLVKKASCLCPVSSEAKRGFQHLGVEESKIEIVPNVFDADLFYLKKEVEKKSPIFTFIHVSEMVDKVKDVSGLIRAASALRTYRTDFRLCIVGYGKDSLAIQSLVNELDPKKEYILFEGKTYAKELSDLFNESDAFVLNSRYESFSVVTIEAMACGLPVVAPRVGALPELVFEKSGILFSREEKKGLEIAMKEMIERRGEFSSADISDKVFREYTYDSVGQVYSHLYEKAMYKKK